MFYVQLTSNEQYVIYHLKLFRLSLREIGRGLERTLSTISRELKRNGPASKAHTAQTVASPLSAAWHAPLRRYVERKLRTKWSSDVISKH